MEFRSDEYNSIIKEHFDLMDDKTRGVLLAVNENDQNQLLVKLTSKLYDSIINRVDDIDFGDIPATRGDLSALPSYDKLEECVTTIHDLLVQYKQDTSKSIDIVREAINNLVNRKTTFELAYKTNVELPIILYNTLALSVISSVSFMISTCIDYIKNPNGDYSVSLDKVALAKTKDNLLFNNLKKFNDSCRKGDFDKSMQYVIKTAHGENLLGVDTFAIMNGFVIGVIALTIIPLLRELIYFFYYSRVRVSDYFDIQADLLQMNINNINNNTKLSVQEKEKVINKQTKILSMFRSAANKIAVTCNTASNKATNEVLNSSKKYKIDDVTDVAPDSATSALF